MATRPTRKAAAAKPAAKAAAKPAAKKAAPAAKTESKRVVATALMDVKSAEFKQLSPKYQGWVKRWQTANEDGVVVADVLAKSHVHRILGHNKGLFIFSDTKGQFLVGSLSASGKSFTADLVTEDIEEAWALYYEQRSGAYKGPGSRGGAAAAPAAKPAAKKAAAKPAAPARGKKAAPAKAAPKPRRRAAAPAAEDDLEDIL